MNIVKKSIELGGRTLSLEVGRLAEQASAAVVAQYGETMVLATAVVSQKDTSLDYFPLNVEYVERLYAGGRIKGSRWVKREGRPTDDAVLAARVIDRSIRPLFPKSFKKDVQVIITVLSVDGENDPDVLGLVAASAALSISQIPWNGPISGVRMGYVNNQNDSQSTLLVNPTVGDQAFSEFDFIISGTSEKVVMLEGGFCETSEEITFKAIKEAKIANGKIIELINELVKEVGKEKITIAQPVTFDEIIEVITKNYKKEAEEVFVKNAAHENGSSELTVFAEKISTENESKWSTKDILTALDVMFKKQLRKDVLEKKKRVDGRKVDEIRPIEMSVGVLTRTHGSAIFKRGQTQALTIATLGTPSLEQLIESPMGEESKRYIHHYSMPPYSVGETGRVGTPNRREIGHGALAERALLAVIPPESVFPYTIRLVSEIMSSNGSTSMASTCGSTLALMDAGVPIKAPVAGISVGLMTDKENNSGKFELLTDIVGVEDFAGDMDFKVAGTTNGITAIQLDIKIDGLTDDMVLGALERAKNARMHILEKMKTVIIEPRKSVSKYAPKVQIVKVPVEKIGEIIGPGGKMIRSIISSTGASVDVEDDGSVTISSIDEASVAKAVVYVEGLIKEVQAGEEYEGEVKRILPFGAFVEILPGKEGLVHVSQMSTEYVSKPDDVVSIGQKVKVRVLEIDDQHRVNLSMLFGDDIQKVRNRQSENNEKRNNNDSRGGRSRPQGGGRRRY